MKQRCWFHKSANVLAALPKSAHPGAIAATQQIYNAEDIDHARVGGEGLRQRLRRQVPKAVEKITGEVDVLLEFYNYPAEHWVHLRPRTPIESTFAEALAVGSAQRRLFRNAVGGPKSRVGGQAEQPAQVRRLLHSRRTPLEQLDVLKGDVVNEVSKLKQSVDGQILVYASRQLVHTLMKHDLVDELRLMVYPVVLGAGERLFGETSDKKSIRPLNTRTVGDSLVYRTYEIVRNA